MRPITQLHAPTPWVVTLGTLLACGGLLAAGGGCGSGNSESGSAAACDDGSACRDSDCDTICDLDEGDSGRDTDGDGQPDYLDQDSDGDGLSDREEAGDSDAATPPVDRNENGTVDAYEAEYPLGNWMATPIGGGSEPPGAPPEPPPTPNAGPAQLRDGGGAYEVDAGASQLDQCPASQQVPLACQTEETDLCDGLDNDCDGQVDLPGGCTCKRGQTRACFSGPPGRRGVGACADGYQVCKGAEFPSWGPCLGGAGPTAEVCDGVDNDCNGCTDELASCGDALDCPEPGDPRIAGARPFSTYPLRAEDFYSGGAALSYRWRIAGSPCDKLFASADPSATPQSGRLSYQLRSADQATAEAQFALSGDYVVSLEVTTADGTLGCDWVMPVRGPGVRVELCWPQTGPITAGGQDQVDLDVHVARELSTPRWHGEADCFHRYCAGATSPWSFPDSPLSACLGSRNSAVYEVLGSCPNPRLDADNRLDAQARATYVTENVNLDNPTDGDVMRVMVEYNDNAENDAQGHPVPPVQRQANPIVNVYCGGRLKATFGGDPERLQNDSEALSGFDTPGQRWHVTDLTMTGSGPDADCEVAPLAAPAGNNYWVTDGASDDIAW